MRRAWVPAGRRGCLGCGAQAVLTGGAARVPRTLPEHHLPGTRLLSVLYCILAPPSSAGAVTAHTLPELTGGQSKR